MYLQNAFLKITISFAIYRLVLIIFLFYMGTLDTKLTFIFRYYSYFSIELFR